MLRTARTLAPLAATLLLGAAAPAPEQGTEFIATFDHLCLHTYPNLGALEAELKKDGATPMSPENFQTRLGLRWQKGSGWMWRRKAGEYWVFASGGVEPGTPDTLGSNDRTCTVQTIAPLKPGFTSKYREMLEAFASKNGQTLATPVSRSSSMGHGGSGEMQMLGNGQAVFEYIVMNLTDSEAAIRIQYKPAGK